MTRRSPVTPKLEAAISLIEAKGWSWSRRENMIAGSSGPVEDVGGITLFRGTPFQIIALDDPHPPGTPDCCEDNFHVRVGGPGQLSTEAKVASIEQAVYWLSVILPAIDKEHHKRNVGDVVDAVVAKATNAAG